MHAISKSAGMAAVVAHAGLFACAMARAGLFPCVTLSTDNAAGSVAGRAVVTSATGTAGLYYTDYFDDINSASTRPPVGNLRRHYRDEVQLQQGRTA